MRWRRRTRPAYHWPLAALALEMMHTVRTDGLGDADHSALIRFYEKLAGVEVGQAQVKEIVAA